MIFMVIMCGYILILMMKILTSYPRNMYMATISIRNLLTDGLLTNKRVIII